MTSRSRPPRIPDNSSVNEEVRRLQEELERVKRDRDDQAIRFQQFREATLRFLLQIGDETAKSRELQKLIEEKVARKLARMSCSKSDKKEPEDNRRVQEAERERVIIELQTRLAEAEVKLNDAEVKLIEGDQLRKKLLNDILELKGKIRVFCRVRPLLPEEGSSEEAKVISYPDLGRGIDVVHNGRAHAFAFDRVFMPDSSQDDVFAEISELVQNVLDGDKVCIFAYGQTGSGKTYTMMGRPGDVDEKGLIPRSVEKIVETIQSLQSQGWKYALKVSMLEIYNETIMDLLESSDSRQPKTYAIKHDSNGNTEVSNLTVVEVYSTEAVSQLLRHAAERRSIGKTQMNEHSSRSHVVFTLRICGVNEITRQHGQGVLNLIDLAGSERVSKSGVTGDSLKETQAINKSLSALTDVISALAKKQQHVPFRNSKLTMLLEPCLRGHSKTLMFVNVSPAPSSIGETVNALHFAARVSGCNTRIPQR